MESTKNVGWFFLGVLTAALFGVLPVFLVIFSIILGLELGGISDPRMLIFNLPVFGLLGFLLGKFFTRSGSSYRAWFYGFIGPPIVIIGLMLPFLNAASGFALMFLVPMLTAIISFLLGRKLRIMFAKRR